MKEFLEFLDARWTSLADIFLKFSVWDAVDIVIISLLLYFLLIFLKKQNAYGVIKYIFVAFVVCGIVLFFSDYLSVTARLITNVGALSVALIMILFPHEIRRLLWKISSPKESAVTFSNKFDCSDEDLRSAISEIVRALQNMSKRNVGALLVFANNDMPTQIIESGVRLHSLLSTELLESIFSTKGPLHDGAVVIHGNKIVSAGCFLPLSQNLNLPKDLGTRHRAALGVSESCDVTSIIVSEETGVISVARGGKISRYYDSQMLNETLEQIFGLKALNPKEKSKKTRRK